MVVNRPVTIKTPIKTSRVPAARPSGTIHRFTRSVPAKNQLNATAANTKGIPSPRAYVASSTDPCAIVGSRLA